MKIKVLIKENINKTYNVLESIKNNPHLQESLDMVEYYNDQNWLEVFEKAYNDFTHGKFRRFVVVDDYAYGPFLFISKQKGWVATSAFDEYSANLIRAHNNSKVCIIPTERIESPQQKINSIITAFAVSEFDAGRHVTRLQILHGSFVPTDKALSFASQPTKKVVIGSDHAGYALKEAIKEHLQTKGYQVIDVGTNSLDSTHYSLFGAAIGQHIPEVSFAIGCCYTGMGMANTLNKYKGVRACVCMTPENAKIAREVYGANTLVLGSRFSNKEQALQTVDAYIETAAKDNPIYKSIDNLGFAFDKAKFKEIKLEKTIVVPQELN